MWSGPRKTRALQWDGYLVGVEVGYVALDVEDRAFRAYAKLGDKFRLVGWFRDSKEAKRQVMFEVVELPLALCEAFRALSRSSPATLDSEPVAGTVVPFPTGRQLDGNARSSQ